MEGPDFIGHLPSRVSWSLDSRTIYFNWNPEMLPIADKYKYTIGEDQAPVKLSLEEEREIPPSNITYDSDHSHAVFVKDGDLFLAEIESGDLTQIVNTVGRESNPSFINNDTEISFIQDDNVFIWNIEVGTLRQLTDFTDRKERKNPKSDAQSAWLERDQLEYFEILRERDQADEYREERRKSLSPDRPKKIYLDGASVSSQSISPDGMFVGYRLSRRPSKDERTIVPDYVTEDGYTKDLNARPKVGSDQTTFSSWIFDVAQDSAFKIDEKQIPGIYDKPDFLRFYHQGEEAYVDTFTSPRDVVIHGPFYNAKGDNSVVVIRSADNKDRWIMTLDPSTRDLDLIERQRDTAWIGGPGIEGWNFVSGTIGWLPDDETIYYQSEETGYSHLYTYHIPSGSRKMLTSGDFEVMDVQLSKDGRTFYLHASAEGPFEHHFYRLSIEGGTLEKLSEGVGRHDVSLSPDQKICADLFSYSNKPTELFYWSIDEGEASAQITNSTTDQFNAYSWRDPDIIRFTASDGAQVPARLYRPERGKKNGAAVIFVHGAGYLHNVHKWWSSYYREFMFHNFLADQGYTVLDIDYRASAGYGRDWRTGIYRFMGGKDLSDQVDGAKYLVEEEGIDENRLGIYGGSYGGFITLMALTTAPGTFKCGAALRSVTDWAHYNHGYTSNILNTPVEDSIAYYRSSPIYHAEKLEGDLVMLHGMVDTNVHFQDVVRMAQRFIEAGKDNWELAVFPMEGHGFVEPSSWADEYKRIYRLFERNLRE